MARFFALVFCLVIALAWGVRRPLPSHEINLDLPPEQRFNEVVVAYNATFQQFFQKLFVDHKLVQWLINDVVAKRGPEPDAELQAEIRGVAALANVPVAGLQAMQMLYELQTLMVPIYNISWPWRGPGCTGIIGLNKADGTVYHVRNLDFSPKEVMQSLTYEGIFTRGGKEVFRAQMIAGYQCIVTGMKMGPNGFAVETNTRYGSHWGGNEEMLKNLLKERRTLNGWSVRKILETAPDYEAAVHAFSTTKYVATQYNIISGVKKGTILARDPDSVAFQLTLGQKNPESRDDYIMITNFDYWAHDIREWFDPTGGRLFRPRRIVAQKQLNATAVLTADALYSTINKIGVIATDTIFQGLFNVEKGIWNVSLPDFVKS